MSIAIDPSGSTPAMPVDEPRPATAAGRVRKGLTNPVASGFALLIGIVWTIPTAGLLVQSFRGREGQQSSGWWTFKDLTLDNYREVTSGARNILPNIVNSIVIVIPAALIPIAVAAMAAYALVWIDFRGRDWIYVAIFALQIVPLQVAVVPLLRFVVSGAHVGSTTIIPSMGLSGTVGAIWLAHACFALPLAVFLMHNFMSEIPRDLLEAARIDGASHGQIFRQIMLPLLRPALAAFGIFQFLWVWNDLFVGIVMSGGNGDIAPITVAVSLLIGNTSGAGRELIPAAAFLSIIIPLIVFIALQRFFVRGLLSGSVKG
ncbi:MAG: alpha-glucoside transport system permease protein [Pseudonocardiales bacterium]|jgi:alpha-glucoside transport system permease protein|nr:alpha-glucoside transport system permease protein [Pseudonocardiales bacterium]